MKMIKGLSLLELIAVMAIVATLMGLGLVALFNYRYSVQLQSAYNDTVSAMKVLQNNANNSTSVRVGGVQVPPDYYSISFNNSVISPYYCIAAGAGTLVHCDSYPESGIRPFRDEQNVNVSFSNCSGIGIAFSRLTGKISSLPISAYTGNGTPFTTGVCSVVLTHNISGDTKTITVDLDKNKIDL